MMQTIQTKLETALCPLYLVISDEGLHGIHWKKQAAVSMSDAMSPKQKFIFKQTKLQLEEYLQGKRQVFDLPLKPEGTPFQKKVWQQLSKIPYGKTRSYKDIATAIQNSKACRAVGTANGRNPFPIVVPCHRVINSSGTLGGFGGGLPIKEKLLNLENVFFEKGT